MAQKIYRKLQFDSTEKGLDKEESSGDEDADSPNPTTLKSNNTLTSVSLTTPEKPPDPSIVLTRDYYGLADTVGGNHSCLILITNRSKTAELRDPVVFTKKGYNRIPPDARIPPETSAYCAFRKPSIAVRGTSGVISYEYSHEGGGGSMRRSRRFAVMWKVPYRVVNREENEIALKWMSVDRDDPIDSNMHTTAELYGEMAKCERSVKDGWISREVAKNGKSLHIVNPEDGAELDATFSGSCKAVVKVDFNF